MTDEQALRLLELGPSYMQTVIRTPKAVSALRFLDARVMTADELRRGRETVRAEEKRYQERFAALLSQMTDSVQTV